MEPQTREDLVLTSTKHFARFLMKLVKPTNENKAALIEYLYAEDRLVFDFEKVCNFSTEPTTKPFVHSMASPETVLSLETFDRSSGAMIDSNGFFFGRNQVHTDNINDIFNYQRLINPYDSQKLSELHNSPEQIKILLPANNYTKSRTIISENFNQGPRRHFLVPAEVETLPDMLFPPGINEMSGNVEDQISHFQLLLNHYENQNSEPLSIINQNIPEVPAFRNDTCDDINQPEEQIDDDILVQQDFKSAYENQNGKEPLERLQARKDSIQEGLIDDSSTSTGSKPQSSDQLNLWAQIKKTSPRKKTLRTKKEKISKRIRENKQDKAIKTPPTKQSEKKNLYRLTISHLIETIKDWSNLKEEERSHIPIILEENDLKFMYDQLEEYEEKSKQDPKNEELKSQKRNIQNHLLEKLKLLRFNFLKEIMAKIEDHADFSKYLETNLPEKPSMKAVTKLKDQRYKGLFLNIITSFLNCDDIKTDPLKYKTLD